MPTRTASGQRLLEHYIERKRPARQIRARRVRLASARLECTRLGRTSKWAGTRRRRDVQGGLEIELAREETWGTGERGATVAGMVGQVGVGPSLGHAT